MLRCYRAAATPPPLPLRVLHRGDLYDKSHLEQYSVDLGNGWWMGTNLSSNDIRKHIVTACRVSGIRFGSQLTLIEE